MISKAAVAVIGTANATMPNKTIIQAVSGAAAVEAALREAEQAGQSVDLRRRGNGQNG